MRKEMLTLPACALMVFGGVGSCGGDQADLAGTAPAANYIEQQEAPPAEQPAEPGQEQGQDPLGEPGASEDGPDGAQSEERVALCHVPPGNPENAHTIHVGQSAVEAHLNNHGDREGPCDESQPVADPDEDVPADNSEPPDDCIPVCHAPPGNPENARTICVGSDGALQAHLSHGDAEGECADETAEETADETSR